MYEDAAAEYDKRENNLAGGRHKTLNISFINLMMTKMVTRIVIISVMMKFISSFLIIHIDDHKSLYIPSLAQTIHFLTTPDPEQRESFLAAERPPRWYWGLIQVYSSVV